MTASADYGVSIVEDFTPEENWLPGQKVNKDVSVVNTGNVDAFVRTWLQGEMDVVAKQTLDNSTAVTDAGVTVTAVTDPKFTSIGLTYTDSSDATKYYKQLDNKGTATANADSNNSTGTTHDLTGDGNNDPARFTEVQSVQAGGYLVYAPNGAKYSYKLEQAAEVKDSTGVYQNVPKDTIVYTTGASGTNSGTDINNNVSTATNKVLINGISTDTGDPAKTTGFHSIDSDTFVPETKGVYIFRRNVGMSDVNAVNDYEYTGYYYDGNGKYFALCDVATSNRSDYVLPDGAVTVTGATPSNEPLSYTIVWDNIKLFTAKETVYKNDNASLTWDYSPATAAYSYTPYKNASDEYIYKKGDDYFSDAACTIAFTGDTSGYTTPEATVNVAATVDRVTFTNNAGISIDVELANIGSTAEKWTKKGSGKTTTFYYNNDVEEGDTTSKLIDSMTLSSATEKDAYLAFDFDLNVFMESIQVTKDETGSEGFATVNSWAATGTSNTAATGGEGTVANGEITLISWS